MVGTIAIQSPSCLRREKNGENGQATVAVFRTEPVCRAFDTADEPVSQLEGVNLPASISMEDHAEEENDADSQSEDSLSKLPFRHLLPSVFVKKRLVILTRKAVQVKCRERLFYKQKSTPLANCAFVRNP